jgi:hypothetical protein
MKKMLTLVLILSVASLASALSLRQDSQSGMLSLSYDGTHLTINLLSDLGYTEDELDDYFGLEIVNNAGAAISTEGFSVLTGSDDYSIFIENGGEVLGDYLAGTNGVFGGVSSFSTTIPAGAVIWDIAISGLTDGTEIRLGMLNADWDGYESVYFEGTFIPEPMTIALLSLGGLFLRRRK